jgi:hypothetical protein
MRALGHKVWAIPGGYMPAKATGVEPEFVSCDILCLLNTSDKQAEIEITIYHSDRDPAGPYPLEVGAQRSRHVRFNDFIDPEAIPLNTSYSSIIRSSVPILVQYVRQDTRQEALALAAMMAYPIE